MWLLGEWRQCDSLQLWLLGQRERDAMVSGGWRRRYWKTENWKTQKKKTLVRKGYISYINTYEVSCFWEWLCCALQTFSIITVTSRFIWSTLFCTSSAQWKSKGCSITPGEYFILLRGSLKKQLLGRTEGPSSLISQQCKPLVFALMLWQLSLRVWWSSWYKKNSCRLLLLLGLAAAGW